MKFKQTPKFAYFSFTLFSIASAALVVPSSVPSGWSYNGCYMEATNARALAQAAYTNSSMTSQMCIAYCASQGFGAAGTEYYTQCFCDYAISTAKAAEGDCNTACGGDSTQPCGGPNRLTVFTNPSILQPAPNTGIANWTYIGCYSEATNGRALTTPGNLGGLPNTGANCAAACQKQGFILAGTEYSNECYCGNSFSAGSVPVTDGGCNMKCGGNQSEYCGGPNRLNVYDYRMSYPVSLSTTTTTSKTTTTSSTTTTTTTTTTSSTTTTTTKSSTTTTPSTTTTSTTTTTSSTTTTTTTTTTPSTTTTSTTTTTSSTTTTTTTPSLTTTSSTTAAASSSSNTITTTSTTASATPTYAGLPPTVGNYNFLGCQTEANGARALNSYSTTDSAMTLEKCGAFCASKGSTMFGAEYGAECYCGNTFQPGSVMAPITDCNMACGGNNAEFCGAGNRLSVYLLQGAAVPSQSTTTTTSATPLPTTLPTGWSSQGCWVDNANGRILPSYQAADSTSITPASCAQLCFSKGYNVSGTEYYTQCFCDNAIYNGGVPSSSQANCNTACKADSTQMCGGANYMSIVSNGVPKAYQPPATQTTGLNNTWTYQGCYKDFQTRVLPWGQTFAGTLTPSMCLGLCGMFGYTAAGLEYGQECYCGDVADVIASNSTKQPETDCNMGCAGNQTVLCGAGNRLSMYYWSGSTPLYTWNYPQGVNAGTYSNLIGGVVVPLITMQSITGKVTFLEKWGTGAPNSTGAYELDLSIGDMTAWREMHLKTDVFCSAGLILPDKAGRQLNVGGWSTESLYGVRLYWPNGSPGVNGTNDWEEDVNSLSLQVGRWYPSAMVMSNGSILVIGGEDGSNGAAVPSVEVLPYTGTPPVYMDWLAATDPWNLYPFASVLPSGNILVCYWNQARLLDPVTLGTVRVLPQIPGSVFNAQGGRTYPLEGTSILLPQSYPYTDPITVLMCGGSTPAGGLALDNCVSTQPDVANATWAVERMPSKRVMSCMAPLPDGTILIANGAKQGVAGFGLASIPNQNAVLYDPSKPLGTRMSVMANTSVARLYHSEAITLLDGRVLITGSDPEDGVNPEERRIEVFTPPYLLTTLPRPTFNVSSTDWAYGGMYTITLGTPSQNGGIKVSLLAAVSSTHGNSMGARTLFPQFSCSGRTCTVTAPPNSSISPPGWFQLFVLDGPVPAVGIYVRVGGDPAKLGNWPPNNKKFHIPGV